MQRERGSGYSRHRDARDAPRPRPPMVPRVKRRPAVSAEAQAESLKIGRQECLQRFDVSRETQEKLDGYVALLLEWQARINLVSPATIADLWHRHIADSLQLEAALPAASRIVDLGSGGGLPGIPVAILRPDARTDLVESNGKKAAFLRTVVRELDLPATVHASRIEEAGAILAQADVVTARALASLPELFGLVAPHMRNGALCFFMKGETHAQEIEAASAHWRFEVVKLDSALKDGSVILRILDIAAR